MSATVPHEWEVFNMAAEIDGKPVTSLDNIFKIRQESEDIRIDDNGNLYRDLWSVKWYSKDCFPYKLKQINVPNNIKSMPVYSGYVPLMALCEEIGCDVEWSSEDKSVYITLPE